MTHEWDCFCDECLAHDVAFGNEAEATNGPLTWGPSAATERLDAGYRTAEARRAAVAAGTHRPATVSGRRQRALTPLPFAEALLALARGAA